MTIDLAIIGASGDVGRYAAHYWSLLRNGAPSRLRLGGRNIGDLYDVIALLPAVNGTPLHSVETFPVDAFDQKSLDAFVKDAQIVLNCAGPSHHIRDRVAVAAQRAGADYVDTAGDDTLASLIEAQHDNKCRMLLSAGMRPGLSGLLPRWLAHNMPQPRRLVSHIGVRDRFTSAAACDFLAVGAGGDSMPLAAWRDGPRQRMLCRLDDQQVSGFSKRTTLLPYLDREGERVARALGIHEGDWYSVVEEGKVLSVFERAQAIPSDEAIRMLQLASIVDLAGRHSKVVMTMQLDGKEASRGVHLRADGNGRLSGAFAAVTVEAIARAIVPVGLYHAAEVLDPVITIERLHTLQVLDTFFVNEGDPSQMWNAEEGVI